MATVECPRCAGYGWYDVRATAGLDPAPSRRECDYCDGYGDVEVSPETVDYLVELESAVRIDRERLDAAIRTIGEQRQHIATLEALLKAERDRAASLERHITDQHEACA